MTSVRARAHAREEEGERRYAKFRLFPVGSRESKLSLEWVWDEEEAVTATTTTAHSRAREIHLFNQRHSVRYKRGSRCDPRARAHNNDDDDGSGSVRRYLSWQVRR